jgi:hypothetical protein
VGGAGDLVHGGAALLDAVLAGARQFPHLVGGLGRALGQLAHLVGHRSEAPALGSSLRRLDGRVEREQVGAPGDLVDHPDRRDDPGRRGLDRGHLLGGGG